MIKQISITFDFNTETEEVTNIKTVGSVEKKPRTTKKLKDEVIEMEDTPIITLEPNKLVFNNKAIADLEASPEDRIAIEWKSINKKMIPTIRKDDEIGNKLSKTNTVVCRGKANTVLAELGTEFTITPYTSIEGVWILLPTSGSINIEDTTLEQAIEATENIEPELLVDTDEETPIDELKFQL